MTKYQRRTKEERKLEIREAAMELFLKKGYSATTMEAIVDGVNLSKGSVYKYYPSKEEMLLDLLKDGMNLRNKFLLEAINARPSSPRKLSAKEVVALLSRLFFSREADSKQARLYSIFLYEKRFHPNLERVYEQLYRWSLEEMFALLQRENIEIPGHIDEAKMEKITMVLNTLILGKFVMGEKVGPSFDASFFEKIFEFLIKDQEK